MTLQGLKAAPKGMKALSAIYSAQRQQDMLSQLIQKAYVKATANNQKRLIKNQDSSEALSAFNQGRSKSFYGKYSMAKAMG